METVLLNGEPTRFISVYDRGLQFGDGLFETIAIVGGRPCLWARHLQRLSLGCRRLNIPEPDPELLDLEVRQIIAGRDMAVLKLILTRGGAEGARGYRSPANASPNRLLYLADWPDYPEQWKSTGVEIHLCDTRLGLNPGLAGIKHLNRLEQVMARNEWTDPDIAEGLVRDAAGRVVEGTMSNLFLQKGDELYTPLLDEAGVAGTLRSLVMDIAAASGKPVLERHTELPEVEQADALYLTNALIGVWRVRLFAGLSWDMSQPVHPVMQTALESAFRP